MKKQLVGLLTGLALTGQGWAQSPYTLKTGREAALLGAGVVSYGTAYAFNRTLDPLTTTQIGQLNPASVPAFDRSALRRYSPDAARLSDLTLGAGIGLTGVVILSAKAPANARPPALTANEAERTRLYSFFRSELYTVGIMYVETMLLTNGVKSTVKNAVERTRPYAYSPDAPLTEKLEKDTQRSFYSGHAANAFATAVFAAEVFRHYHPNSAAKPWIWIGSLGLASGTAYLRYEAGQHFPTDLLVGSAVGALAGWGIPKLHENRSGIATQKGQSLTVSPWSNGGASGVYLRLTLTSQPVAVR